jgi:hypothetical protein
MKSRFNPGGGFWTLIALCVFVVAMTLGAMALKVGVK